MSEFKVPYTTIIRISEHNNADSLELAWVYGFQIVVKKNKYKAGDRIIFIPPNSVLPMKLEELLFPQGSKIVLHKHRLREIRIRGLQSQGMIVDPITIKDLININVLVPEEDLSEILGITKYEPPVPGFAQTIGKNKQRNKKADHTLFHAYNGVENIKWYPDLFQEGEEVVIQEKLHGTSSRAAILPFQPYSLFTKILNYLNLLPKYEKLYASNNVQISRKSSYKGFYSDDIYGEIFRKINVFKKIKPDETIYGEIVGPSIQKNYTYGFKEHHFILFDVKILQEDGKQKWLNPEEVEAYAKERGFDFIPVLYRGPYNKELAYSLTKGPSVLCPQQKVREGIVIKSRYNYDVEGNKKSVKWLNEVFLDDKSNTEHH